MASTTIALIREKQIELIEALVPESFSGVPYREYAESDDFRDWCEASPNACFRSFYVEDDFSYEPPLSSNLDDEEIITSMTLLVAYPQDGRYGLGNRKHLHDLIRQDMHQLDTALGHRGYADYVSGQNGATAQVKEVEDGESVSFLVMNFELNFRKAL